MSEDETTETHDPECPECESAEQVRPMRSGRRLTCDGCGLIFTSDGAATTVHGPRPGSAGSRGGGDARKTTLHEFEDGGEDA